IPSGDFSSEDLFSSLMMSMHSSTHSSQMNTVGPAMSLRTSCWLLPQNEQWSEFFVSVPSALLILESGQDATRRSRNLASQTRAHTHGREGRHAPARMMSTEVRHPLPFYGWHLSPPFGDSA